MTLPREMSESGYYHIVSRGVGQMVIFEQDEDRRHYLRLLKKYRDACSIRVIAWVLMDNHVHLIVDCGEDGFPSAFMQGLNTAYACYFRDRTKHVGHVFERRYWSKPIQDNRQLLATTDYVHANPERAGLSPKESYRWSSYQEYLGRHWVTDTSVLDELLGVETYIKEGYHYEQDDVVRQQWRTLHVSDRDVLAKAIQVAHVKSSGELHSLNRPKRNELVKALAQMRIQQKQIARVLGIGAATVSRILAA